MNFVSLPTIFVTLAIFTCSLSSSLFADDDTKHTEQESALHPLTALKTQPTSKNIFNINTRILIHRIPLQAPSFYLDDYPLKHATQINETFNADDAYTIKYPWHPWITANPIAYSEEQHSLITYTASSHQVNAATIAHNSPNLIFQGRYLQDDGYKENADRKLTNIHLQTKQELASTTLNHHLFFDSINQQDVTFVVGKDSYKNRSLDKLNPIKDAKNNADQLLYFTDIMHHPAADKILNVSPYLRLNQTESLMDETSGLPTQETTSASTGLFSSFTKPYSPTTQLTTGFNVDYTYANYKQHQEQAYSEHYPAGDHYDFVFQSVTINWALLINQELNDQLNLIYDVSIDQSHYFNNSQLPYGSACSDTPDACMYYRPDKPHVSFLTWSPLIAAQYDFNAEHNVLLSLYQQSITPNGLDLYRLQKQQNIKAVKPQRTNAAELKFSGDMMDRINYQVLIFLRRIDHFILSNAQGIYTFDQKIQSYGLDSFANFALTEQVSVTLALSLNNSQTMDNYPGSNETTTHNTLKLLPQSTARVLLNWLPYNRTKLQFEVLHEGSYYLNNSNSKKYPGHELINVYWQQSMSKGWHLLFAVKNLTNARYAEIAGVTRQTSLNPDIEEKYIIGNPRSFTLGLSKSF